MNGLSSNLSPTFTIAVLAFLLALTKSATILLRCHFVSRKYVVNCSLWVRDILPFAILPDRSRFLLFLLRPLFSQVLSLSIWDLYFLSPCAPCLHLPLTYRPNSLNAFITGTLSLALELLEEYFDDCDDADRLAALIRSGNMSTRW